MLAGRYSVATPRAPARAARRGEANRARRPTLGRHAPLAGATPGWKQLIVDAQSEDAVRFETWGAIMAVAPGGYDVVPRVLRTDFVREWQGRPDEARDNAERLREEIMASMPQKRPEQVTPFTGQTAGLIDDVLPVAEIVRAIVADTEAALEQAAALRRD